MGGGREYANEYLAFLTPQQLAQLRAGSSGWCTWFSCV